jgi:hypothetical protein
MEGLCAEHLIADKGCDSDAIVDWAEERGMVAVIPPRKNRKVQNENTASPLKTPAPCRKRLS